MDGVEVRRVALLPRSFRLGLCGLFPRTFVPADVQQKLKLLVRAIDPHPVVTELGATHTLPWSFRSIS